MSSIFKSKRISSDSKSSASKSASSSSSSGREADSKSQRNSASTSSSSSSSKSGPGINSNPTGGGGAAHHSKAPNYSKAGKTLRSQSIDVSAWADEDCPAIDSRFAASTVNDKTLSISRSGRYKAKGKIRTSLFSDESIDGTDAHHQGGVKRGTTRAASSSSSSYEDRPTVLHMTGRPAAAAESSGRNPLSNHVKSDVSSPSWSATPNSVDL